MRLADFPFNEGENHMENVLALQGIKSAPGCCGDPCDNGCGHGCDHIWISVILGGGVCL
jgi:hypothetical protein